MARVLAVPRKSMRKTSTVATTMLTCRLTACASRATCQYERGRTSALSTCIPGCLKASARKSEPSPAAHDSAGVQHSPRQHDVVHSSKFGRRWNGLSAVGIGAVQRSVSATVHCT